MAMWDFIQVNWKEILGFGITIIGVILPFFQYISQKRLEQKDKRFQNYHKLIDELVGAANTPKLDRQVAIIFELFNFKDYHLVTLRILNGLKESWSDPNDPDKYKRLIDEIDLTVKEIERYQALNLIRRNFFRRK
ncbi:MAG: hypothetical protein JNK77_20670 [Saprospiraceae bacterium]|nr:hypothetical protein [Saprospiraceae bacterium]